MSLHRLRIFDALVPYFGGKRRLLGAIFKYLPGPAEAPVLADAFLGGASVSLYAKARGYRVLANDLALRSTLIGHALLENDRVLLGQEDLIRLFVPDDDNAGFVERHFCPDVVTTRHARFLDNALAVARKAPGVKRWLLLLLAVKYLYRMRPMGNFGAKSVVHQMEEGAWDEMNPAFLRDALVRGVTTHPKVIAETLRQQINRGVFAGAGPCQVSQLDAAEFLRGVEANVVVLDPPYAGTLDYSKALKVVDQILAGEVSEPVASAYSGRRWQQALHELFEAGRHIPTWAITFGNAGGKGASLDELVALVRRHRPVALAQAVNFAHCTGLASEEARAKNLEYLVIARKD